MTTEVLFAVGFTIAIAGWMAIKHTVAMRRCALQRQIATTGVACQGRVVAIQRPSMLDDCTRLYVDFVPAGSSEPVRVCHVEPSANDDRPRAMPAQGMTVTVCYLPQSPQRAVIGQLVG